MKQGINKVIVMGNVGRDPETKFMQSGEAVVNFSIATSESWKDKTGEKQEKTEWHNIVAYRKLAEIIGEYVRKGSKVYVEGKLQTRKWQDKDGKDRYTTEIIADEMQILSKLEKSNDGEYERSPMATATHTRDGEPIPAPNRSPSNPNATFQAPAMTDDFDDDIPF